MAASVTVITGAGSGLGRALARRLACPGQALVLVGRRPERLLETRAMCVERGVPGGDAMTVPADVTAEGAPAHIVASTMCRFGRLDALVNNAGLSRAGALVAAADRDAVAMLQTNLIAPAMLIKHALPHLRRVRGVVVNVGSIGGLLALPNRSYYGASKAALAHLTRSLARELAPDVRVNAVLPGAIDTEMYDHLGADADAVARLRSEMVRTTPLGRMGSVEDVVPWIEMLLGPAGSWMTGSLLVVDGGRACGGRTAAIATMTARARRMGERLRAAAAAGLAGCPHVAGVRGVGPFVAIDLLGPDGGTASMDMKRHLQAACEARGVLIDYTPEIVMLAPPLTLGDDEADLVAETVSAVIWEASDADVDPSALRPPHPSGRR